MEYLAIDVGGTFIKYAIITDECQILMKSKCPTIMDTLDNFLNSLVEIYEELKTSYKIAGIGLSMPGMIDSKNGFMYTGGNIRCCTNLNIVEVMQQRCGVPITVENDAKCAALAELWKGSLKECQNAIVLVCGTGIGGAVIRNREVLNGTHFLAGEFSYIITEGDAEYELKNCVAENTGIASLIRFVSETTKIPCEALNGEKIFSMANCGDEKVLQGLRRYVKHIAVQIHNYQYILDPERFAIGGGISVQPLFLQLIQEELQKINNMFPWTLPRPEVVVCQFYNDANLIGAVYVHMKSKEKKISMNKINELIETMGDCKEAEYLKELLMQ